MISAHQLEEGGFELGQQVVREVENDDILQHSTVLMKPNLELNGQPVLR